MTGRYIAISSLALLASCSNLSDRLNALNPLTFLGGADPAAEAAPSEGIAQVEIARPDDGKTDIPRVRDVRLEYTPSGIIIRANGEAPSLGYHSASLRPLNFGVPDGNGAIWFEFRATPPGIAQPGGEPFLRTLSVASFVPNSRLGTVRSVTITGSQNDVSVRLR